MIGKTASTFAHVPAGGEIAHGGRLAEARRLFPGAAEPIIDLSTGINPRPYPVPDVPAEVWARLPEPSDAAALEAVAAATYGGDPTRVVAAPGTQVLISLLPRIVPLTSVAVVGPTYAEHAAAWAQSGAAVTEVGSHEAAAGHDGIVLCNPNNPDGRRTDPDTLAALASGLAARGGLLVVDEAFADLEDGPLSLIPDLPGAGVVVLRSFGKTYGLAGLRLGFAVAGPELAAKIRAALGPWAVSGPAIGIGRRALADTGWLAATRARLDGDRQRLDGLLTRAGLAVVGGTRLYRLAESAQAPAVFDRLGQAGIFVRRFAYRPDWLRFGMPGDEAAWARLAAALG
ncbi:threonine-phosphate decarboxylase CobD [Microbaculum marinisediminis]|uniref:threonine-phosphate decarboxylase n=1 Tax=Microbaculum marinisediminis TaxID=2931392 RepID=A0AAW5QY38_9HYPH|nr:threonine-phosphate decarboxylase CobD [Microbaculum sp. A6E488]MCT8971905.1 threonine-phosphate decarboxylase CobD [Microbaculum sp. A6E488]